MENITETEKIGRDFVKNVTTGTTCVKCCMNQSAEEITFDEKGVCNFCKIAQNELALIRLEPSKPNHWHIIQEMKKGSPYSCLIGLSGGVDSSYMLHLAVKLGLKPLCFNVDNSYNSPESDENIMRLVETLKVPFFRYTIDTKKFRELQEAFIKAGQKNIEIPTDAVLLATSYELANKYKIGYILSGGNVNSESIMPASWGYNARDLVHIKDVYKKMTGKKLKGLPTLSLLKWNYLKWIKRIKVLYLLDYYDYNREEATKTLEKTYGWKSTGEKHCESYFTRWFQDVYLYRCYSIDKRRAHYSALINSGQMDRDTALEMLKKEPVYDGPDLGFKTDYPHRDYREFRTDERLFNGISKVIRLLPIKWRS